MAGLKVLVGDWKKYVLLALCMVAVIRYKVLDERAQFRAADGLIGYFCRDRNDYIVEGLVIGRYLVHSSVDSVRTYCEAHPK